ncbi:MAG: EthD family reductase [Bacteroidota bacterium]|nr:EthD family reductase [Ferruginibacter sp.]
MRIKIKLLLVSAALAGFVSCKTSQLIHASTPGNEMFKVTVLYPNGEGKTFDMNYYETKHMPMVAGFLGENLKFYEIDKGISGRTPSDKVPFLAVGYFYVKDVAAYGKAIGANRDAVVNDFKNYTNIQPVIQISEVKQLGFNNAK